MKTFFMTLVSAFCLTASAAHSDISQCKVMRTTKMRISGKLIKQGSVAVTRDGKYVGTEEILSDAMIYFQSADGQISDTYQWMYNKINKVQNRDNKYLATSFGEDVIVTLGDFNDPEGQMTVTYAGTKSGNYLSLICE